MRRTATDAHGGAALLELSWRARGSRVALHHRTASVEGMNIGGDILRRYGLRRVEAGTTSGEGDPPRQREPERRHWAFAGIVLVLGLAALSLLTWVGWRSRPVAAAIVYGNLTVLAACAIWAVISHLARPLHEPVPDHRWHPLRTAVSAVAVAALASNVTLVLVWRLAPFLAFVPGIIFVVRSASGGMSFFKPRSQLPWWRH